MYHQDLLDWLGMKILTLFLLMRSFSDLPSDFTDPFTYQIPLDTTATGTSYVNVTLADAITESFLVDTGSGLLVINTHTYNALKKTADITFSHQAAARLANGNLQQINVFTVERIRIGEQCELSAIDVAVIAKGRNILGMQALKKAAPFAFSIDPPALFLSQCSASTDLQN